MDLAVKVLSHSWTFQRFARTQDEQKSELILLLRAPVV